MKYKIVDIINLETGGTCDVAIERNRIGRVVELMYPLEEGYSCMFLNPNFSTTQTSTVKEIIVNHEDAKIFLTKNSEYVLERVEEDESND